MAESKEEFLSLLFEEGRVLTNLKFFPGPDCASADQLFEAATAAIRTALDADGGDLIPAAGSKSIAIADYVSSL